MRKRINLRYSGFVLLMLVLIVSCSKEPKLDFPHYGAFTIINKEITEIPRIMGEPRIDDVINNNPVEIDFENNHFYLWWPEVDFDTLYFVPLDDYSYIVEYNVTPLENEILQISPREIPQPGVYCLAQGGYLKSPIDVPFWCFQIGLDRNKASKVEHEKNHSIDEECTSMGADCCIDPLAGSFCYSGLDCLGGECADARLCNESGEPCCNGECYGNLQCVDGKCITP